MFEKSKKQKCFVTEEDISTLLQRSLFGSSHLFLEFFLGFPGIEILDIFAW